MRAVRVASLSIAALVATVSATAVVAQSERNGRLLPTSTAPTQVAPSPVVIAPAAETIVVGPTVAGAPPASDTPLQPTPAPVQPPARTGGPTVLPGAAESILVAVSPPAAPAKLAVPVSRPQPPIAARPEEADVASRPTPPVVAEEPPAPAETNATPSDVAQLPEPVTPHATVRMPVPAVRLSEAAVATTEVVREAEALRSTAEEELAAVVQQEAEASERPAVDQPVELAVFEEAVTEAPAEPSADVAIAKPAVSEVDAQTPHMPAAPLSEPGDAAEVAVADSVATEGLPHTKPASSATVHAADAAAEIADAPAEIQDTAGATSPATSDEPRRPGVRWIAGHGLPPPSAVVADAATEPAASDEPAEPAAATHAGASKHATPTSHADADGEAITDHHQSADAPAADATTPDDPAPRKKRRPSTAPIAAPYELVRTLQAMQDDMAAGSTAALAAQRALLQRMEDEFADADPLVWQDRRNARALVTYTLGGGRPVTLRRLLTSDTPPDGDEALMRGALAYVEGDQATAKRYLLGVDARALPASLGGQLALAQAALAAADDPKATMELLDTARLLAPGTLVEEAALRRQIFVASEMADVEEFENLSRQYLRRYRRSVYAGNFRKRFAAALSRMTFLDDPAQFHRLDDMLSEIDVDAGRELYLVVAQAAVNEGKTALAATAAERALATAPSGSVDEARARLYRGAALAVSRDGLEAAMVDLDKVERQQLPRSDAMLLQAASETAELIQTAASTAEENRGHPMRVAANADDQPSETATRAVNAITAIDALLEEAQ